MHRGLSQSQHHRTTRSIAGSKAWRKTNGGSGPLQLIAYRDDGGSIPGFSGVVALGTGTDPSCISKRLDYFSTFPRFYRAYFFSTAYLTYSCLLLFLDFL